MRKSRWILLALVVLTVLTVLPGAANAAPPSPDNGGYETFICPATSTHNARGMWVLGAHGAYYVQILTRGTPEPMKANKVFVKVDAQGNAVEKAQVPAGYALYKDVFGTGTVQTPDGGTTEGLIYTSQDGKPIMLLGEGVKYLGSNPFGWDEGAMLKVMASGSGYKVMDMDGNSIMLDVAIPAAAGVFW